MTFAQPLALLGLLPLGAMVILLWRQAPALVPALPGGWARLIAPPLRRYMARDLERPGLAQVWLILGVCACLVVAIARPLVPLGDGEGWANLVGRVIVIDAEHDGMAARRIAVDRLLALSPDVPTALVAVAGDAYQIVPFTTDAAQIDRYLRVLEPDAMPVRGIAVHTGLAMAERILADARVVAGQIVLVVGAGAPGSPVELPDTETLKSVVVAGDPAGWDGVADLHGADLVVATDLGPVTGALDAAVRALRAGLPGAAIDIAPWLYALAGLLTLGLFRRRAAS